MRSKNKITHKMMAVLAAALIVAMLLTSCGGGGGGGGSTGGGSSTVEPTPTPTPTPDPVPDPTPTPDPGPLPGTSATLADPATGIYWVILPEVGNTCTIMGYDKDKCTMPQNVVFPEKLGDYTVTAIASGIFDGETIVEITVPETVTEIGDWAFSGAESLKKATIKGPAKLGKYMFYYCSNLQEVYLNDNITEIPDYAFAVCRNLSVIHLPAKLERIGNEAFYTALDGNVALTLPETLTTIDESAFEYAGVSEMPIPGSVKKIGKNAFADSGLTNIKLMPGVEEIGDNAFDNTRASDIYLPHSLKSVGQGAFNDCRWLVGYTFYYEGSDAEWKKVSIDSGNDSWNRSKIVYNVTPEQYEMLRNGTADGVVWTFRSDGTGLELSGYDRNGVAPSGSVVLPDGVDTVSGKISVTSIGVSALQGCTGVTSIKMPETVEYIGYQAFFGCTDLTNITLPKGVQYIEGRAFQDCTALTGITLQEGLTTIGDSAFKGCTALTGISLPKGLTDIGSSAFENCTLLSSISLPTTLKSIGDRAFQKCTALRNVTFPEGLLTIGEYAFYEDRLLEATIPASVTKIGYSAFYGNKYMKKLVIKGNPKFEAGYSTASTFGSCTSLEEVQLNDNIAELPSQIFFACPIQKINLPSHLKTIGDGALRSLQVKEVKLPDTVTSVGENAFAFSGIEKLAISKGIQKLPHQVFWYADLKAVYIPKSVTSIELSAFENCYKLKDIYYSGSEADWAAMKVESTGNEALTKATIHYNASVSDLGLTEEFSLLSLLGL